MSDVERLSKVYGTFAEVEATGRSPLYMTLARGIASDNEMLAFLATLPPPKQQPNLLLAAVKFLYGTADSWAHFRDTFNTHRDGIVAVMMARRTQTNEAARCATLLPILARLPQPLALIEVGAAAGLCLLPDHYAYDFNGRRLTPASAPADAPVFSCALGVATPNPSRCPEIVWRAGLDLNPIDPTSVDETRWLEALVWPGEGKRLENLRGALRVAASDPPRIVRGDLRTDLPALAAQAPKDATLVVFHTAVLSYVWPQEDRDAFARIVRELGAAWICNEGAGVFPSIADQAPKPWPPTKMLQAINGNPFAWSDPHGATLEWFSTPDLD